MAGPSGGRQLAYVLLFVTPAEIEAQRKAAYEERMQKLPELDAAIKKTLTPKPHKVEIVAVQG